MRNWVFFANQVKTVNSLESPGDGNRGSLVISITTAVYNEECFTTVMPGRQIDQNEKEGREGRGCQGYSD